jgi:hypothetical protein
VFDSALDTFQLLLRLRHCQRIGIATGMDFHNRRASGFGSIELMRVSVDEQRNTNAGLPQGEAGCLHTGKLAGHIQTAFGGQFLSPLRNQTDILRQHLERNGEHFVGDGHFQIHLGLQQGAQDMHIGILDVAAVFAQMQGDRIRASRFRQQSGLHRARITGAARLTQRGDVVDVDAQFERLRSVSHSFCRSIRSWRVASGLSPR